MRDRDTPGEIFNLSPTKMGCDKVKNMSSYKWPNRKFPYLDICHAGPFRQLPYVTRDSIQILTCQVPSVTRDRQNIRNCTDLPIE